MKEPFVFLTHVTECIEKIEEYTASLSKDQFLAHSQVQDAVLRRLEIIGEAIKNLPAGFVKKYPDVPWSAIVRTRDKLIHGYFGIDLNFTWEVLQHDIPSLKEKIQRILTELKH